MLKTRTDTEEDCLDLCRNAKECRTMEYNSLTKHCYLQTLTALDISEFYWFTGKSGYNYYQKMCA